MEFLHPQETQDYSLDTEKSVLFYAFVNILVNIEKNLYPMWNH